VRARFLLAIGIATAWMGCAEFLGLSDIGDGGGVGGSAASTSATTGSGGAASGSGGGGGSSTSTGGGGAGGGLALSGDPRWARHYAGGGDSRIQGLTFGPDNKLYATGTLSGTVTFDSGGLNHEGGGDVLLVRLTPGGVDEWAARYGSNTENQQGRDIAMIPDGSRIFVASRWTDDVVFDAMFLNPASEDAVALAWTAGSGAPSPAASINFGNDDLCFGDAIAASDTTVALGGSHESPLAFGSYSFGGDASVANALVVAMDPTTLALRWADAFGTANANDRVERLSFANDGDLLAVGEFGGSVTFGTSAGTLTMDAANGQDGFLVRYDATTGAAKDSWNIGTDAACKAWGVATAGDDVLVAGEYNGMLSLGTDQGVESGVGSGGDVFVARLAPDFSVRWARISTGSGKQQVRQVAVDGQGHVVLAGMFRETFLLEGHSFAHSGDDSDDLFVAKLDGDGKLLWGQAFGGNGHDNMRALAIGNDDSIYIGGTFTGSLAFGGSPALSSSNNNIFIAKLAP
jgi:hypothetical protein